MSPTIFPLLCLILGIASKEIATPIHPQINHRHLTEILPKVLVHVFKDTYIFLSNTVSLVPGCVYPRTRDIQNDILSSLLIHSGDFSAFEIQTDFSNYDTASVTFVLFIDSYESFRFDALMIHQFNFVIQLFFPNPRNIFMSLYKQRDRFYNNGYFTVVLLGESVSTLEQLELSNTIFNAFWSDSVTNILLLTSDPQRTTFYTYFIYSADSCGHPQTIAHNYYWHDADNNLTGFEFDRPLFPKKCNNLFNCSVNVATFEFPPFMILREIGEGKTYFDGIEGIVLRVLSQRLNFIPILVPPEDSERWGACDDVQKHCNGSVKLVRMQQN